MFWLLFPPAHLPPTRLLSHQHVSSPTKHVLFHTDTSPIPPTGSQPHWTVWHIFSVQPLNCPQCLPLMFQHDSGVFWPLPPLLLCPVEALHPMFRRNSGLFNPLHLSIMSPMCQTHLPLPLAYNRQDSNGTPQEWTTTMEETAMPTNFLFFPYILTTSYRVKNTPTWACFLFSAAIHPTTTSLTPSYPVTPNHQLPNPTSPLLWTPKMCLHGRVFGVCRLSSAWKPEPCPQVAPFPFPSCGQQKLVHADAFLLSAGSPPLLFVGFPSFSTMPTPEMCPQEHILMLAGSSHIPHPPPTILIGFHSEPLRSKFHSESDQNQSDSNWNCSEPVGQSNVLTVSTNRESLVVITYYNKIQWFIGLINYVANFLSNISMYTSPLQGMTQNGAPFHWKPVHQRCFDMIKHVCCKTPVIRPINSKSEDPIWVVCNTSKTGIGVIYSQGPTWNSCRPAGFMSKKFTSAQQNYAIHKLETLAILEALIKWEDTYYYGP